MFVDINCEAKLNFVILFFFKQNFKLFLIKYDNLATPNTCIFHCLYKREINMVVLWPEMIELVKILTAFRVILQTFYKCWTVLRLK